MLLAEFILSFAEGLEMTAGRIVIPNPSTPAQDKLREGSCPTEPRPIRSRYFYSVFLMRFVHEPASYSGLFTPEG
jgi:hypothetical protein